MRNWLYGLLDGWVNLSLKRPWLLFLAGTVLFFGGLTFALRLELRTDLAELLPTDAPSVVDMERLKQTVMSYSTLSVVIESPDLPASQRFAEDLVAKLRKFQPDRVRYIDYNINEIKEFYKKNQLLYADVNDIETFREKLKVRIQEETESAVVESLDDTPRPKTDLGIDQFREEYERKSKAQERYPGGYYVTKDHTLLVIFLRPPSEASSLGDFKSLVADVRAEIDALKPATYHPQMTAAFTGDAMTSIEEHEALAADVQVITIVSVILILGVIIVFYRSVRAVMLIGMPLLLGLSLAFAVTQQAIGYLNTATAFLSSIVAGNGINFMLMLAARFYEEIRAAGPGGFDSALKKAVRGTAAGTIVASLAAAIAYGSLSVAGFRGFRQFGLIGGVGMLLCWITAFTFGPPLLVIAHRLRPFGTDAGLSRHRWGNRVGDRLVHLVTVRRQWVLFAALVLSAASIYAIIPYSFDPFEYDFRKMRNEFGIEQGSARLSNRIEEVFEKGSGTFPIVARSVDDVRAAKEAILSRPGSRVVLKDVRTIFDLLPKDQDRKVAALTEIRGMIDRKLDFLGEQDREDVEKNRPADDLRALGIADLPEEMTRAFKAKDGTLGRIMYAYRAPDESLLDGRYLLKLEKFLRAVPGHGDVFTAVGQPMIFADMVRMVVHDGVVISVVAVIGVLALLVFAFRKPGHVGTVLASVGFGTLWMLGYAALFDVKLNFLNFVVIPITLGIGVDYGANLFTRYRQEGPGGAVEAFRSTGAAVVLASATTIFGYGTLLYSSNLGLQSFGNLAVFGEFTCLGAAELVMIAMIVRRDEMKR